MTRVFVIVEGQTEESFVNNVVAQALWPHGVYLTPIILGVPGHRGGRPDYVRVKKDVLKKLKEDMTSYCSTMLDFYGLGKGFPGTPLPPGLGNAGKVSHIEQAMKADLISQAPDLRPD